MIHIALLWSANNQRIATIDIPLLWSGKLETPVYYTHDAPLGLNTWFIRINIDARWCTYNIKRSRRRITRRQGGDLFMT